MATKPLCIRINTDLITKLDDFATEHEWSRNYVIVKFLKEKINQLTGESS